MTWKCKLPPLASCTHAARMPDTWKNARISGVAMPLSLCRLCLSYLQSARGRTRQQHCQETSYSHSAGDAMQAEKTATCTWPPPVNMSSRRAPNSQRIRHSAWLCSARCTACRRMARRLILQARHGTTHTSKPGKRAKTPPSHPRPEKERFPEKKPPPNPFSLLVSFSPPRTFFGPRRGTGPFGPFSRAQNRASPERHADGRAPQKGTRQCSGVRRFLGEKRPRNEESPAFSAKRTVQPDIPGPCSGKRI